MRVLPLNERLAILIYWIWASDYGLETPPWGALSSLTRSPVLLLVRELGQGEHGRLAE